MMAFARLLLDHGEKRDVVFNQFIRDSLSRDWASYYYSTQEKLQTFLTLTKYLQLEGGVPGTIKVSLKS